MPKTIDFESKLSNSCSKPHLDRLSEVNYQLSVVIPVYRSQESLRELYQRLVDTLTVLCISFEILFVED